MPAKYIAPEVDVSPFTCPRCTTLCPQLWRSVQSVMSTTVDGVRVAVCTACRKVTLWEYVIVGIDKTTHELLHDWRLVYPSFSNAPEPNPDLPPEVCSDYDEAASIAAKSPRGAAALLRLCVQKLCKAFGQPGKHIDTDIGALVKDGVLRPQIQRAMDTVRITGNAAVHPGELDVDADPELVASLFDFVNLIAQEAITIPNRVDEIYERMPEGAREAVERRDNRPVPAPKIDEIAEE